MSLPLRPSARWYHDFPKLARESGFYFNIHRTPVRIDWNRMSTIDIDRVIRDRDFATIDENVNNVVDYSLENTYDVKILDANFVKIFRFAQLSVEYLLYCRQYLDQSVILLKDDLKSKLEENHQLKKELSSAQETIKDLKTKFKDKYKVVERKLSDSNGEIHKCPHCPKTFITSIFMASHISRRHSNLSLLPVSPVHEEYRAEAEKLHNEIKSLKERLNETERVIRTDSSKLNDSSDLELERTKAIESFKYNQRRKNEDYDRYREDLSDFKRIFFTEIQSLKTPDEKKHEKLDEKKDNDVEAMKTWTELIKQQENEIQRLRDQLQTQLKPDIASVQSKLDNQESLWLTKIQEIERQHKQDMEKLKEQLMLNQQATEKMRTDYVSKIDELEKTAKFNETTTEGKSHIQQRGDLETSVTIDDIDNPPEAVDLKFLARRDSDVNSQKRAKKVTKTVVKTNSFIEDTEGSESSGRRVGFEKSRFTVKPRKSMSNEKFEGKSQRPIEVQVLNRKFEGVELSEEEKSGSSESEMKESVSNVDEEEEDDEETEEEEEETDDDEDTEEEEEESEESSDSQKQKHQKSELKTFDETKSEINQKFNQRLKNLGIDPEWQSLPSETYRQLSTTITHQRSLNRKKYRNWKEVRQEALKKLSDAVSRAKVKVSQDHVHKPKSRDILNKTVSMTTRAIKGLKVLKTQMHGGGKSKEIGSKRALRMDLLPSKLDKSVFQTEKPAETKKTGDRSSKTADDSPEVIRKPFRSFETAQPSSDRSFEVSAGDFVASTPFGRDSAGIFSPKRSRPDIFVRSPSPVGNKSVLKSSTPGTTSLTKKKVLFDLYTTENEHTKMSGIESIISEVKEDLSESNEEVSSSVDGNLFGMSKSIEKSTERSIEVVPKDKIDDSISKPSTSEKIIEIAKKVDKQLSLVRKKPIGGVQAMFASDSMLSRDVFSGLLEKREKSLDFPSDESDDARKVKVLPKPAPRSANVRSSLGLLETKSNSRESNLDRDIEELLRLD